MYIDLEFGVGFCLFLFPVSLELLIKQLSEVFKIAKKLKKENELNSRSISMMMNVNVILAKRKIRTNELADRIGLSDCKAAN